MTTQIFKKLIISSALLSSFALTACEDIASTGAIQEDEAQPNSTNEHSVDSGQIEEGFEEVEGCFVLKEQNGQMYEEYLENCDEVNNSEQEIPLEQDLVDTLEADDGFIAVEPCLVLKEQNGQMYEEYDWDCVELNDSLAWHSQNISTEQN
jgi:hypothetical protein